MTRAPLDGQVTPIADHCDRLVGGEAQVGDLVTYQDMANPPRTYRVTRSRTFGEVADFELEHIETGEIIWSDLRQYGWTFA